MEDACGLALLTSQEIGEADRLTIKGGVPGIDLMEKAGGAVADAVARHVQTGASVLILCGPGNNGGDGFVAARLLSQKGFRTTVLLLGSEAKLKGDALLAFQSMGQPAGVLNAEAVDAALCKADILIDALFGAGLDRPLTGEVAAIVEQVNGSRLPVISVDLPSGISGNAGAVMGVAIQAVETVTFFRCKPGHVLLPGREKCGSVSVAQIGIDKIVLDKIGCKTVLNAPALWIDEWRIPGAGAHKYSRGHALVFGGGIASTGAARLGAMAALRGGAGLVTLASPPSAIAVNAAHLTAIMQKSVKDEEAVRDLLSDARYSSVLIGPGFGVGDRAVSFVETCLEAGRSVVLDADALTSFASDPERLFGAIADSGSDVVLTPHGGEFTRLFQDLAGLDRLSAAREASRRCGAVILLKGADTVIADPTGYAAINDNAPPWLATAGSGDVLAGIICGLLAQGMPAFEAAAMAVWLHGETGNEVGPGLIAEDLAPALRPVLTRLVEKASVRNDKKQT